MRSRRSLLDVDGCDGRPNLPNRYYIKALIDIKHNVTSFYPTTS